MLAATTHDTDGLLTLVGVLIVLCCLAGAAWCAYMRNVLAVALLLIVAIVTAFLLLA